MSEVVVELRYYIINERTLYLEPFLDKRYNRVFTRVVEIDKVCIVQDRPFDVILHSFKASKLVYSNVYRQARKALQSDKLLPIVLSVEMPMTLFPIRDLTLVGQHMYFVNEQILKVLKGYKGSEIHFVGTDKVCKLPSLQAAVIRQRFRSYQIYGTLLVKEHQRKKLEELEKIILG